MKKNKNKAPPLEKMVRRLLTNEDWVPTRADRSKVAPPDLPHGEHYCAHRTNAETIAECRAIRDYEDHLYDDSYDVNHTYRLWLEARTNAEADREQAVFDGTGQDFYLMNDVPGKDDL